MRDYTAFDLVETIQDIGSYVNTKDIHMAKVIKPLPKLEIEFDGMKFQQEQLMMTKRLYDIENEKIVTIDNGDHTHAGKNGTTSKNGKHLHKLKIDKLKAGDTVIVYSDEEYSNVVIIDKVVNIHGK